MTSLVILTCYLTTTPAYSFQLQPLALCWLCVGGAAFLDKVEVFKTGQLAEIQGSNETLQCCSGWCLPVLNLQQLHLCVANDSTSSTCLSLSQGYCTRKLKLNMMRSLPSSQVSVHPRGRLESVVRCHRWQASHSAHTPKHFTRH